MITTHAISKAYERIAEPENQGHLAHSFWHVAITIGVLASLASTGYGAYAFLTPVAPSAESAVVPSAQALNAEELRAVIEKLDGRTERFQLLVGN